MKQLRGYMNDKHRGAVIDGVEIHWKSEAIVEQDSKKFAAELERILNAYTAENYQLTQLLFREKDSGAVLLFQRCTPQTMSPAPPPPTGTEKKEAN